MEREGRERSMKEGASSRGDARPRKNEKKTLCEGMGQDLKSGT